MRGRSGGTALLEIREGTIVSFPNRIIAIVYSLQLSWAHSVMTEESGEWLKEGRGRGRRNVLKRRRMRK